MSEIERVAQAICLWDGMEWDGPLGGRECSRKRYRDMANAAIAALDAFRAEKKRKNCRHPRKIGGGAIGASRAIAAAASRAVTAGMILASEREEVIKAATSALRLSGSTYICGETITLTRRAQDGIKASAIRNMTDAQFGRFAVGL